MPSFCLAFQGFQLCSFRHWKIRPSLINVVFVSLRLCCLRSGLWSALWLDSTLLDFKILGLRHSYSFAPYVPTPGARQTAALIHSNILPRCKISLFCSEDATAIFVECLQIMINWRWGWIAAQPWKEVQIFSLSCIINFRIFPMNLSNLEFLYELFESTGIR